MAGHCHLVLMLLLTCERIPPYLSKQLDSRDSWTEGLRSFCARLLWGTGASDAELEADRESESEDELVSFDESVDDDATGGSCADGFQCLDW
jgi:hypothetical protein